MEIPEEFMNSWQENIYQKAKRSDFSFWHEEGGLMEKMLKEEKNPHSGIMKIPKIEEEELVRVIKNMKNGKASGIDGISAELMKYIIKDDQIRSYTLKCFNNALLERVNGDWLTSKTTMIPKNRRPQILEHRPIAVTVNSSKIIWTIMRERIEEHLKEKNIIFENQYGFTRGGRSEHCFFILDYIANRTYTGNNRKNKSLYYAFIDFKKAYDSINREKLIEVLIRYKINPI